MANLPRPIPEPPLLIPEWTKFSEVDEYLARRLRRLEAHVAALADDPNWGSRTFVSAPEGSELFCQGTVHVWIGDSSTCTCKLVAR